MATINSVMTKMRTLLAALNTKTGRNDATFTSAINALPSKKTASDVTVSGNTVTTPSGIYFSPVQKTVSGGGTISTASVEIDMLMAMNAGITVWYNVFEEGQVKSFVLDINPEECITLESIVTDSFIIIKCPNYIMLGDESFVYTSLWNSSESLYVFEVLPGSNYIYFWE